MLVLSRFKNERIVMTVGAIEITVVICDVCGDKVRMGFDAPREVTIHRAEVHKAILAEHQTTTIDDPRWKGDGARPEKG